MTIDYKDSKRIVGLSTDARPTNPETNSILVEKNTADRYWYNGTSWLPTWTFTDNLSDDTLWTPVGSGITVTGGEISIAGVTTGSGNYLWRSLSHVLSDTLWTMELDYRSTAQTGSAVFAPFGVRNSVGALYTTGTGVNEFFMRDDTDNALLGPWTNTKDTTRGSASSIAWTEGSFYYPRMGRTTATTSKYQLFSNTGRTSQVGSTQTHTSVPSTLTGLTHFVSGGGSAGGGTSTGKIDNIYISESDLFT